MAQSERDRLLANLAKKSGLHGERFTADDLIRLGEGNGRYFKNGSENLELAIQQKNSTMTKEANELDADK